MNKKQILTNKNWTSGLSEAKKLITIKGTLTSSIQLGGEETPEPYHYAFIKLKEQKVDLPVIFKIKDDQGNLVKPSLKKNDRAELVGHYSNSAKSVRKSFTCLDYYRLVTTKECSGCGDKFICSSSENYDYCSSCELNGSRYLPGRKSENKCSECSDGSGTIKFPQQPPRACKTCHLAKLALLEQAKFQLPKLEKSLEQITQIRQKLTGHE